MRGDQGFPVRLRFSKHGKVRFISHRDVARAPLDGSQHIPAGSRTPMSQLHIRVLLSQMNLGPADLDMLAIQLTAALDGPLLLYLSADDLAERGRSPRATSTASPATPRSPARSVLSL